MTRMRGSVGGSMQGNKNRGLYDLPLTNGKVPWFAVAGRKFETDFEGEVLLYLARRGHRKVQAKARRALASLRGRGIDPSRPRSTWDTQERLHRIGRRFTDQYQGPSDLLAQVAFYRELMDDAYPDSRGEWEGSPSKVASTRRGDPAT